MNETIQYIVYLFFSILCFIASFFLPWFLVVMLFGFLFWGLICSIEAKDLEDEDAEN